MADRKPRHIRGQPCPTCGIVHERCLAHTVTSVRAGAPKACGNAPRAGHETCTAHGAASDEVSAEIARLATTHDTAVGRLATLAETYEVEVRGRPHFAAIEDIIVRTGTVARFLRQLVGELDEPTGLKPTQWGDLLVPHVLVEMERAWLKDHLAAIRTAVELGMDERRLRVEEAQVADVFGAVMRGLERAGVATPEVREAIAAELRAAASHPEAIEVTASD